MLEKLKKLDLALTLGDKKYYEDFDITPYKNSLQPGSMPADGLYEYWIQNTKPNLVIEVGSFLGYSAIKMAKEVKRLGLPTKIICVDTWLGSPEHYRMYKAKEDIRIGYKNGYPTLYQKFITSVIENDVQDIIIPFPYPSSVAYKILDKVFQEIDIKPEFIFLDGSHEENDVYMDLYYYYQLLAPNGSMWGDDYEWEGVHKALDKFSEENKIDYKILQNRVHWFIQK
jgi:predicted O-methyltransferase YrrM